MNAITLTDGGTGQELVRRHGEAPTPLWSARVMEERPGLVTDVHVDFIAAGARVITLNSYAATPERLAAAGVPDRFEPLQRAAIDAARAAIERAGVDGVRLAGCLPPLVASYRPDVSPPFDEALALYRRIVEQQAGDVDLLLCETLSSIRDARAAATAACESGLPVWLALSISDEAPQRLRSGERLDDAFDALEEFELDARLLNCSAPESITDAWSILGATGGRIGAYANAFESVESLEPGGTVETIRARRDLDPNAYAAYALTWVERGADIVGGCCEVGPAHIATLRDRLASAGYQLESSSVASTS